MTFNYTILQKLFHYFCLLLVQPLYFSLSFVRNVTGLHFDSSYFFPSFTGFPLSEQPGKKAFFLFAAIPAVPAVGTVLSFFPLTDHYCVRQPVQVQFIRHGLVL